jgi:hypothetical protein
VPLTRHLSSNGHPTSIISNLPLFASELIKHKSAGLQSQKRNK